MEERDFWTIELNLAGTSDNGASDDEARQKVRVIAGIRPLDSQLGVWPKKTVPDALAEVLFAPIPASSEEVMRYGGVREVPTMATFALLDAARAPVLPELLAVSELDWCCLFSGKAEEDLRTVAPYLVKLDEDDSFTRRLFTRADMPDVLWDRAPGIFLRSRQPIQELRRQFRKFTRIQDESGRWYYFRFWEPAALDHVASDAGSDLASRLWTNCRVIWRSEDDGDTATFCVMHDVS